MSSITDLHTELEQKLHELVVDSAKSTLYDIVKYELDELAVHDPSFSELVKQAKKALISIEVIMENADSQLAIVAKFKEYIGILESIARSIVDKDNRLLVDNIYHLEQFLEIATKKGESQ